MSGYAYSDKRILALKKNRPAFAMEVLLTECLEKYGVNPFTAYLNTVNDIVDYDVSSSVTLFDEVLEWLEKESFPNYVQGTNNIFSRRFSFAPEDRIKGLGLIEFEKIVIDIVNVLTHAPSVNLSKRSVRPLSLEEVHAALKYKVPGLNVDEVYVTHFIVESGEPKVLRSRRLAEDLHDYLQHDEIPHYHGKQAGIYSVAYSLQQQHEHQRLSISDVNNLVIEIMPDFMI